MSGDAEQSTSIHAVQDRILDLSQLEAGSIVDIDGDSGEFRFVIIAQTGSGPIATMQDDDTKAVQSVQILGMVPFSHNWLTSSYLFSTLIPGVIIEEYGKILMIVTDGKEFSIEHVCCGTYSVETK